MPAYHLRTFYLARQSNWNDTSNLNFFRLEGVTDGSVKVNIKDEVLKSIGWNVSNISLYRWRDNEITISLVATYEQILYILHALFGPVTPSGTAPSYTWTYKTPIHNTSNPQLYVIRYGIGNDVYEIINCFLTNLLIKGSANNAVELEVTMISPNDIFPEDVPNFSFTNVTAIHSYETDFYLSDFSVNPLSTLPSNGTLRSFEINIDTGRHIKRFIGNNPANNSYYGDGKWQIDGTLVLEFDSTVKSNIIDDALTNLKTINFGLKSTSSTDFNKKLSLVVSCIINDSFELFTDADGNATVELSFESIYNNEFNYNTQPFNTSLLVEVETPTNTLP